MALWDDCTECYDFDSGALVDAQKDGAHDLTDNNACGVDAVDFMQGDQSVDLNGTDEYLSLDDDAYFDASGDYSWAFWFKEDGFADLCLIQKYAAGSGWAIGLYETGGFDQFYVVFDQEWSVAELETEWEPTEETWYHVVLSWNATAGELTCYISSESTFADQFDNSAAPESMASSPEASTGTMYFGNDPDDTFFSTPLDGHLDEVAFFQGKALNAAEAESIWDGSWRAAGGSSSSSYSSESSYSSYSSESSDSSISSISSISSNSSGSSSSYSSLVALIDTNLIVRYFCDEAVSGNTPADLLDASGVGTDFDLAINYASDANFDEVSGNRCWEINDYDAGAVARKAIVASDKIDALDGVSTQLTIELVANITGATGSVGRVFGITESGGEGSFMICHDGGTGTPGAEGYVRFGDTDSRNFEWTMAERAVWHFVVDTTLATANDRIKIYKDGSLQTPSYYNNPGQDSTLSIASSSFLCLGNRANDGDRGSQGQFFYAALYNTAFSAQDCSDNYDVLTADDDTPAGGSSSSSYSSESSYSSYSSESSDSSISSISSISSNSSGSSSSYSSLSSESSNSSESSEELGTGEVCWGHDTAVEEFNIRDFTGNITDGSGYRIVGSNDDERIEFELGGYIELETWQFGVMLCKLTRDKYQFGSGNITIKYKNGDGESNCEADTWHTYSIPFACTGWIKVRIESN